MGTVLMIGTRKGLWLAHSDDDRRAWRLDGPHLEMTEVYSCLPDTRSGTPRLLAGSSSSWLGPQVMRSDDLGETWQETPGGGVAFPDDVDASVERVWQLAAGTHPDTVWAGTEPGAVFCSTDRGETFELVRGLWDHPHRPEWGAGFGGQAFHTILPHPDAADSVTVAISTGGVYQTADGGASWEPRSQGVRADFLPEDQRYPAYGQCVHKMARHPSMPERIYLQNHGGVYRSDDHAATWIDIGAELSSDFGFPIVVHPRDPDTVFVFPNGAGDSRWPPDGVARVWRSRDAGGSWEALGEGLPDSFYVGVMRDAMCADDHDDPGLYLGCRNGTVWGSLDDGDSWTQVVANLPDVMVVRAARV